MALIIEDGTGVTDANSYNSVAVALAFFEARGIALVSATDYEFPLLLAMDILESQQYKGYKEIDVTVNELQFPRNRLYDTSNSLYPIDEVPSGVQIAQLWLAHYIDTGNNPSAVATVAVKSRQVETLKTEFAVTTDAVTMTKTRLRDLPNVYNRISHMLKTAQGRVVR